MTDRKLRNLPRLASQRRLQPPREIPAAGSTNSANTTDRVRPQGDAAARERVSFDWSFPQAKEVFIVGSFNNWQPTATPLQNCGDGLWRLDLEMSPGRYDYGFVVDGQRVDDPSITGRASGTHHCVLIVTAHQHGQDAAPLTEATNRE